MHRISRLAASLPLSSANRSYRFRAQGAVALQLLERKTNQSHMHLILTAASLTLSSAVVMNAKNKQKDSYSHCDGPKPILVCGSLNADIIIEINRFPKKGETLGARSADTGIMVPGGKGANQAVAAARLSSSQQQAQFVCQFGNDSHAKQLQQVLTDNNLDISSCGFASKPSGQAFIFLEADGSNSILIVGGSNVAWPSTVEGFRSSIKSASIVLLQREIPEYVNEAVAKAAYEAGVPVIQDVGGEERPFSDQLLSRLTFICPNETELERLTGKPTGTDAEIIEAARTLQKKGVKNVLVTLGADGAILITEKGDVLREKSFPVPGGKVVDTTGAGDCFRAAFAVALVEGQSLRDCLKFAAAAGAITVSRMGAIPSLPTRKECDALLKSH